MNVHYNFLVSLGLIFSVFLWFLFPLSFNAIMPIQQLHIIATFMLAIMWLMSFSGELEFLDDNRTPSQKRNRFVQSKIFVISIMVTGAIIYLIN